MKKNTYKNLTIIFSILSVLFLIGIVLSLQSYNFELKYNDVEIDLAQTQETLEESQEDLPIAVFETNLGNFEIELNTVDAPITTQNFISYVEEGYYNGLIFHRVIEGFMVQGGGFYPNSTQKVTKDPIILESFNGLENTRGTIAMARTNVPNSATSQFFVNTVDNDFLNYQGPTNPGYAVFGKVISGMDVIDLIEGVKTQNNGPYQNWPVDDVIINNAYLK